MITKILLDFIQAVQILLASRESLTKETSKGSESVDGENIRGVDPIQVQRSCKCSVCDVYELETICEIAST